MLFLAATPCHLKQVDDTVLKRDNQCNKCSRVAEFIYVQLKVAAPESQLHVLSQCTAVVLTMHVPVRLLQPPHVLWSDVSREARTCQRLNAHKYIFGECRFLMKIKKGMRDRAIKK